MIPVCEPTLGEKELEYVTDCVKSSWISSSGKYILKFEDLFSNFCNVQFGVSCMNGTSAVHLALSAAGIGNQDEVIIPTFTMIATANAVIYTGAKPVLVDAEEETWNMNPSLIEERITKKTKAIMPVHIYGHPCDMDSISKIAKEHNLLVIEDAAEAHGAEYKGKRVGGLSDVAAFSFYGNKIITTGEGGMVVTNNEEIAERARSLRNLAFTKDRFRHQEIGFNYRMTNIQAAIGTAQMERADELVEMRRKNARIYKKLLTGIEGVTTQPEKSWAKNVYWMFGVLFDEQFGTSKEKIKDELHTNGVDTRSFFYPMHKQPVFSQKNSNFLSVEGDFPIADKLFENGLYFPSSSHLTETQIQEIVDKIKTIKNDK